MTVTEDGGAAYEPVSLALPPPHPTDASAHSTAKAFRITPRTLISIFQSLVMTRGRVLAVVEGREQPIQIASQSLASNIYKYDYFRFCRFRFFERIALCPLAC